MSEQDPVSDLFDLKMLPAWVKESPNENRYADFAGEEEPRPGARDRSGGPRRDRRSAGPPRRQTGPRREQDGRRGPGARRPQPPARTQETLAPLPKVEVRFTPDVRAIESVLAQIKSGHVAYSVFSLARMFLEKPERYDVRLKAESGALFQMGENGPVASDRRLLENGAFPAAQEKFYRVEVVQTEPIKGNFTSVARERVSGTLLGPTNHHAYQQKLRNLYEQRFSRRMSFPEYQRQIEIVSDPEMVERWKEEARSLTTFTTLQEEPPITFQNAADAERHFRQTYLANLLQESAELTVDGVESRRLPDRGLGRLIEDAWAQETRSPTKMMQELIAAFPANGLHLFRHRKAALFVVPVRPRAFTQDPASLSPTLATILRVLTENPAINRRQLLEKMPAVSEELTPEEIEKRKLALASDLRWLISQGHVIEFNDGTLDLARGKPPAAPATPAPAVVPNEQKTTAPNELEAAATEPEANSPNEEKAAAEEGTEAAEAAS